MTLMFIKGSFKMPAVSKSQQRLMGMAHAYNKGELKNPSRAVKQLAKSMKKKDVKDFAKTKHKGLPNKKRKKKSKKKSDLFVYLTKLGDYLDQNQLTQAADLCDKILVKLAFQGDVANFENPPPTALRSPGDNEWYLMYYHKFTDHSGAKPYGEILRGKGPFTLSEGLKKMADAERDFILGVSDGIDELIPAIEKPSKLETIFYPKSEDAGVSVLKLMQMPATGQIETSDFAHIKLPEEF